MEKICKAFQLISLKNVNYIKDFRQIWQISVGEERVEIG